VQHRAADLCLGRAQQVVVPVILLSVDGVKLEVEIEDFGLILWLEFELLPKLTLERRDRFLVG
jgi:hypothetical protein